jgi:hypothetical protein
MFTSTGRPRLRSFVVALAFLAATTSLASFQGCSANDVVRVRALDDLRRDRIPIEFAAESAIFPEAWLEEPYLASATSLAVEERERTVRVIRRALEKYPVTLLEANLQRVYVVKELRFSGIHAAGTNSNSAIYIANDGDTADFIEETVHHEFSSILLRNFEDRFPTHAWLRLSPKDFVYGASGVDAILRHADSLEYDDSWHERGFLHEYAAATLEDDFNSIVEKLFMNDPKLDAITASWPVIATKVRFAREFYRAVDPQFSDDWFAALPRSTRALLNAANP